MSATATSRPAPEERPDQQPHRPGVPAPVGRQPRPSGRSPRRLEPAQPPLRRLPAPVTEPAPLGSARHPRLRSADPDGSDDRRPGRGQGTLALVFAAATTAEPAADPAVAARPSRDGELPDPRGLSAALAGAVVEVLSGHRPAAQLVRWTTADVHTALRRRAGLAARLRSDRRGQRAGRRAVVRRVHLSRPADGVVEVAAAVLDGERVRAVALRLEGWDGRWRATAVEVG